MEEIRLKISDGLPVIPGCRIELSGQSGRQNREGISVSLYGDDPRVLERLLREARAGLGQYPDFSRVSAPRDSTREEVQIRLRRDLARRYGVSTQSVSQILGILMRGRQVRGFRTPEGEVDVIVPAPAGGPERVGRPAFGRGGIRRRRRGDPLVPGRRTSDREGCGTGPAGGRADLCQLLRHLCGRQEGRGHPADDGGHGRPGLSGGLRVVAGLLDPGATSNRIRSGSSTSCWRSSWSISSWPPCSNP